MGTFCRDKVIEKIVNMPKERVLKVLIFMAGMEAEDNIKDVNAQEQGNSNVIQEENGQMKMVI